jgi:hypothetical protein
MDGLGLPRWRNEFQWSVFDSKFILKKFGPASARDGGLRTQDFFEPCDGRSAVFVGQLVEIVLAPFHSGEVGSLGYPSKGHSGFPPSNGPGVDGRSKESHGGEFRSERTAQVRLVPGAFEDPNQLAQSQPGELAVTLTTAEDGTKTAGLWFCMIGGPPGQSLGEQLA